MTKYVILYYPFLFKENLNIGSNVRMVNIKNAFEKRYNSEEIKLIFIHGNQTDRLKKIKELKKNVLPRDILYSYIEFPNIPLVFSNENHIPSRPDVDIIWFKYCKLNNIPLGGFVRDIYWKFPDLFPPANYKQKLNYLFSDYYLKIYKKYLDCMFLPSVEMNEFIGMDNGKIYGLPSGGKLNKLNFVNKFEISFPLKAIYVGSINITSGYQLMLESFEKYNEAGVKIILTMIVRENEYKAEFSNFQKYSKSEWLKIKHLSTNEDPSDLLEADFAILPYRMIPYHDFAMPVKLIEYISFGLPILMLKNKAMNNFIVNNFNSGIIVDENVSSFVEGIDLMVKNILNKSFSKKNIYEIFKSNHTWDHRVEEIEKQLIVNNI